MLRLRFKNTTLEELLVEEAQRLREEAQGIAPGSERLVRQARRAKAGSHLKEWFVSAGLQGRSKN
ncbi:hypothetical protein [Bradyrhizobium japonicum]|uniref:hypothetical protein n=1 Tax=Bradyrhizobium japonicum TaxID=375 RepID=UPI001BA9B396|nr:hypothetical protein [Bradyrhizobium japonicum]MBR0916482.1 hypothetical protein [Bradyrhizobium japonicum]